MKIDTASVRSKNWCTEQMVCIYQHCRQHYEVSFFPIFFEEQKSQHEGETEV